MEDNSSSVALDNARDAKSQLLPSEVLSRAADLIEPEGAWTQGDYGFGGGPCCVVGALKRAADDRPFSIEYERLASTLGLREVDSLSSWNDRPNRTQAEVVAALRLAADLARSEGQ